MSYTFDKVLASGHPLNPDFEKRKILALTARKRNENAIKDTRERVHRFSVNNAESDIIEKKYMLSDYRSMSEFFSDMVIGGMVIEVDKKSVSSTEKLLKNISTNINQIAVRVNSTNNIYQEDLDEMKKELNDIWQQQAYIRSMLQKVQR